MGHRPMDRSVVSFAGVVLALAGAVPPVSAQVSSIVWHEVGDPGNEAWDDPRYPNNLFRGRGTVDHWFSLSETELTNSQWIDFVRAFGRER